VTGAWPWMAVALLGAYHGIDASMGWLFAIALGLQGHRRGKVIGALMMSLNGTFDIGNT
jgi:hypothetical protein